MRIRFALGLPGPFVLTSGRSRRSHYTGLTWLVAGGLVWLGAWFAWPWLMLAIHGGVVLVVAGCWAIARARRGAR